MKAGNNQYTALKQELSKEGLACRFTHLMPWFSCSGCLSRIFPLLWLQVMTTGNLHMLAEHENWRKLAQVYPQHPLLISEP
jgi:hypothetical protein